MQSLHKQKENDLIEVDVIYYCTHSSNVSVYLLEFPVGKRLRVLLLIVAKLINNCYSGLVSRRLLIVLPAGIERGRRRPGGGAWLLLGRLLLGVVAHVDTHVDARQIGIAHRRLLLLLLWCCCWCWLISLLLLRWWWLLGRLLWIAWIATS